jgi:hypothetical protein
LEIFQSVVDQTLPVVIGVPTEEPCNVPCSCNDESNSGPNSVLGSVSGRNFEKGLLVALLVFIVFVLRLITVSTAQVYIIAKMIASTAGHTPCSQVNINKAKAPFNDAAASDTRNEGSGARTLPRSGRARNRRSVGTTLTTGKRFFVRAARCGWPVQAHTAVNVKEKVLATDEFVRLVSPKYELLAMTGWLSNVQRPTTSTSTYDDSLGSINFTSMTL